MVASAGDTAHAAELESAEADAADTKELAP